ncbi:MAG: EamA/RhaT family transporter, partial [Gammaproteobacteria bacterium]|nr:EamA/RhaT family transporter [Gammaproteobacteria bacterium]
REIGPTRTSSFVYSIVPLIVALLALVFFQQAITVTMLVSTLLILTGLHLMLAVESERAAA